MANMQEQMRLFEAETGQGGPGRGGPTARPPPGPPPFRPPSLARAGAASVQKQYSAAPVISRPSAEEDDVFSTLLKYEKEVRAEKRDKKTSDKDKEKKKEKKIAAPQGAIVAAAPPVRPARPAHMSGIVVPPAPPASAPSTTSGTQVTPDEIRIKARQMVDMVKASQATAIKRVAPPSQNKETEGKKGKKQKKMIRVAGGQVSLAFLFCVRKMDVNCTTVLCRCGRTSRCCSGTTTTSVCLPGISVTTLRTRCSPGPSVATQASKRQRWFVTRGATRAKGEFFEVMFRFF